MSAIVSNQRILSLTIVPTPDFEVKGETLVDFRSASHSSNCSMQPLRQEVDANQQKKASEILLLLAPKNVHLSIPHS